MQKSLMDKKMIQMFNEALAMENAALDRIQSRINSTLIQDTKQQLQYHYEQTLQQQERLKTIITNLGGTPTENKAILPKLMPSDSNMTTTAESPPSLSSSSTDTAKPADKSIESSESKEMMMMTDAEKELIDTKTDAIIENSEIVSYKILMEIAENVGLKDAVPTLKQSLQEETAMVNFIIGNTPLVLRLMLPKLELGLADIANINDTGKRSLASTTAS
jgi:ferritin-like metal-binding protein YciE